MDIYEKEEKDDENIIVDVNLLRYIRVTQDDWFDMQFKPSRDRMTRRWMITWTPLIWYELIRGTS